MANNRLTSNREELQAAAAAIKIPGQLRSRQLELREWPRLQDEFEAFRIVNQERDALAAAVQRACNDDPDACKKMPLDALVMEKAKRMVVDYRTATLQTLSVVDGLSKGLARMAGPKTIVFLSEGFVLQDQESRAPAGGRAGGARRRALLHDRRAGPQQGAGRRASSIRRSSTVRWAPRCASTRSRTAPTALPSTPAALPSATRTTSAARSTRSSVTRAPTTSSPTARPTNASTASIGRSR